MPACRSGPSPLIRIRNAKDVWGESEWVAFAKLDPADRARLIDPPSKDSPQDDATGDWTIAAAVERTLAGSPKPQRAVVVGFGALVPGWGATQIELGVVNGRPVYRAPGNLELFESSVYWLAGQDELIARSATAESVPLIPTLGEGQVTLIRWMLIGGLPVIVLLIGAGCASCAGSASASACGTSNAPHSGHRVASGASARMSWSCRQCGQRVGRFHGVPHSGQHRSVESSPVRFVLALPAMHILRRLQRHEKNEDRHRNHQRAEMITSQTTSHGLIPAIPKAPARISTLSSSAKTAIPRNTTSTPRHVRRYFPARVPDQHG